MRSALLAMLVIGGVSVGVACGGPQDAGSPGPAHTPNPSRDPAVDPADLVDSPGSEPRDESSSAASAGFTGSTGTGFTSSTGSGTTGSTGSGSTGSTGTTSSTGGFR